MQPNNILWKVRPDGTLSDEVAALIDFQIVSQAPLNYDITAITMWGLNVTNIKTHIHTIMEHYYKTLTKKLGKEPPVTLEEVKEGFYDFQVMYSIMMINMAVEFGKVKEMFGFSDQRIREMVEKIAYGFELARARDAKGTRV